MKLNRQMAFFVFVLVLTLAGCSTSRETVDRKNTENIKNTENTENTENAQSTTTAPSTAATQVEESPPIFPAVKTRPETALEIQKMPSRPRNEMTSPQPMALAGRVMMEDDSLFIAPPPPWNRESYNAVSENGFISTGNNPLSTFSIDVDTASYSNIRRFIGQGTLPPVGAVRIEEMINYFSYNYPQPDTNNPFSVTTELGPCPWNGDHELVRIGLKARDINKKDLPPSNLVFLIDVSGSMSAPNKLPLLKQSLKMLVQQLDKNDRVSMVVYAGMDFVLLEPTAGSEQKKILAAIDMLGAGGSTHASSGIITAYKLAEQVFMPKGNNRIILASDGDFNVGTTSRGELRKLIEEKRKTGIYLTVLGFGMGNYHDDTMEILADKGNGNYAYIDNLLEAKKVMVKEMSGTMFALAGDVKIQVEFNPAMVGAYRLIGYENRTLADEDFNNDAKDAGEIGVGHTITALYELIPAGSDDLPRIDPLKYQQVREKSGVQYNNELMTVKLRYKPLHQQKSQLLTTTVKQKNIELAATSNDFRFAAAVAGFGMLLQDSDLRGDLDYDRVLTLAKNAKGVDDEGYRAEFIRLVEMSQLL